MGMFFFLGLLDFALYLDPKISIIAAYFNSYEAGERNSFARKMVPQLVRNTQVKGKKNMLLLFTVKVFAICRIKTILRATPMVM